MLTELQLSNPIMVAKEPDGQRLYFIDQDPNYRLCRTQNDEGDGRFETVAPVPPPGSSQP